VAVRLAGLTGCSSTCGAGRGRATLDDFLALQPPEWSEMKRCRERDECREKLQQLGLVKADASRIMDRGRT